MSSNPLRELAKLGRDLRLLGLGRVPINIERCCVIIVNTRTFPSAASLVSCIRMAKLAKWANCEVYFITDPTVIEVSNVLLHFSTQVLLFSIIYFSGIKISQDTADNKFYFKAHNGLIGSDLIFSQIDKKNDELKLLLLFEGINNPEEFNFKNNEIQLNNLTLMAPYPDVNQTSLQQLDLQNENIFLYEFWVFIKTNPRAKLSDIIPNLEKELNEFGQKLFVDCYPSNNFNNSTILL